MARSRDEATCCGLQDRCPCSCEPLVGLRMSVPPWSTPSRARSPKNTSHEMTHGATFRRRSGGRGTPGPCRPWRRAAPGRSARRGRAAGPAAACTRRTGRGGPCRSATTTLPVRGDDDLGVDEVVAGRILGDADGERRADAAPPRRRPRRARGCRRRRRTSMTFSGQTTRSAEPGWIVRVASR